MRGPKDESMVTNMRITTAAGNKTPTGPIGACSDPRSRARWVRSPNHRVPPVSNPGQWETAMWRTAHTAEMKSGICARDPM